MPKCAGCGREVKPARFAYHGKWRAENGLACRVLTDPDQRHNAGVVEVDYHYVEGEQQLLVPHSRMQP